MLLRIVILLTLLSPLTTVQAELKQCQKIVIAGNSQWPPYTLISSNRYDDDQQNSMNLQGVGIEIARQIFAELDIPVEEVLYSSHTEMLQLLRENKTDLIVSTYDDPSLAPYATLLPAYIEDPITVAMPIKITENVTDWDGLVGFNGIKEDSFVPDENTADFFMSYLQIINKPELQANLISVKNGEYQYIVGSDLQLTYAINANDLNSDLLVMKNLIKPGPVHMAFASNSSCKLYAVYAHKRLQDYQNNGTVEKIVKKYIK